MGGDSDAILMALQGAKDLTSDTDKSTLLKTIAATALTSRSPSLRHAYFDAFATLNSDYNGRGVLIAAIPYAHANPAVAMDVINGTLHLNSSVDKAEVLIAVANQRLLRRAENRKAYMVAAMKIISSADYSLVLQAAIQ